MDKAKFFKTQNEFRKWLEKNYDKKTELWVGFYKKDSGKQSIDWPQSVDAALSFGWIDGIRKSIDAVSYKIRFTPRKASSIWSAININKVAELTKLGLMHPAGLKIFNERKQNNTNRYSFENSDKELDPASEQKFKKNKKAWQFFKSQAPSYQKTIRWWITSAKKEETKLKRLDILIKESGQGLRVDLMKPGKRTEKPNK